MFAQKRKIEMTAAAMLYALDGFQSGDYRFRARIVPLCLASVQVCREETRILVDKVLISQVKTEENGRIGQQKQEKALRFQGWWPSF